MTDSNEWDLLDRAVQRLRVHGATRLSHYADMGKLDELDEVGDDLALAMQALRALRRLRVVYLQQLGHRLLRQVALREHYDERLHGGGNGAAAD